MQTDYSHTPGLGFPAAAFRNLGLPGYALTFFYYFSPSRKNTTALFTSPRSRSAIIRVGAGGDAVMVAGHAPDLSSRSSMVALSLFQGEILCFMI